MVPYQIPDLKDHHISMSKVNEVLSPSRTRTEVEAVTPS